ncbi:uncharacterized protein LOC132194262 [Neocloeon triangulifer]|uniref:uncharacterized protein LOC132194262 n=1 Tax=Neocloeon triangulifer TaxID=2078957 RepID=UPI00286FAC80|nr:uncharacterized protein LOC132194262 [Neocloeon triangulifer]XP_059471416.1 uncharacterized protein LOC132194262 [Neocloeon triangulifer]
MPENLGTPFVLCTTQSDSRLLGVEPVDEDCILATFDKVVTKYKVVDQKAVASWSLKEGFSCPAIYDSTNSVYVAVTKSNQILSWDDDTENLQKLKKNTVLSPILKLSAFDGVANVVFQKGAVVPVNESISRKKEKMPEILPAKASKVLFAKDKLDHLAIFFSMDSSLCWILSSGEVKSTIEIVRNGFQLWDVSFEGTSLITFWSDMQIFLYDLNGEKEFPGKSLGSVLSLQEFSKVAIASVGENNILFYGTKPADSSGLIGIYNTAFKVVQEETAIKSAEKVPKVFGPYLSYIFVPCESQVMCASFGLVNTDLSQFLGMSSPLESSKVEMLEWDDSPEEEFNISVPENLAEGFSKLLCQGLPEYKISETMMRPLMEKKHIASITRLLQTMCKISEKTLVKLVSLCLRGEEQDFSDGHSDVEECSASLPPESPLTGGRKRLLHLTLSKPFTSSKLLPEIRRHISAQDAVLFIQHIAAQLWDGDDQNVENEALLNQMVAWISVILDAHYQYFLLTCDQQVTTVLNALLAVIDLQIVHTKEMGKLKPLIEQVVKKYEDETKTFTSQLAIFPLTDPTWNDEENK